MTSTLRATLGFEPDIIREGEEGYWRVCSRLLEMTIEPSLTIEGIVDVLK